MKLVLVAFISLFSFSAWSNTYTCSGTVKIEYTKEFSSRPNETVQISILADESEPGLVLVQVNGNVAEFEHTKKNGRTWLTWAQDNEKTEIEVDGDLMSAGYLILSGAHTNRFGKVFTIRGVLECL